MQEGLEARWDRARELVRGAGIPDCGVCAYGDILPLLPCRAAGRMPEGASSVIVCLFPYYVGEYPQRNLSRYAIVDDYHTVTRNLLERAAGALAREWPEHRFACFVDSSPVREVWAAHRAGLGFIGKNGQLITEEYGSYCFLGEIVTNLELPAGTPSAKTCGSCRQCVDACPGGAIGSGGRICLDRCRSHITQKKGELTEWERESVHAGGMAWGCDLCTDACPHNGNPRRTPIGEFYRDIVHTLTYENFRELRKTRAFGFRGAAVLERNLDLLAGPDSLPKPGSNRKTVL